MFLWIKKEIFLKQKEKNNNTQKHVFLIFVVGLNVVFRKMAETAKPVVEFTIEEDAVKMISKVSFFNQVITIKSLRPTTKIKNTCFCVLLFFSFCFKKIFFFYLCFFVFCFLFGFIFLCSVCGCNIKPFYHDMFKIYGKLR
jgi:ABC-type polysaccharide/polyol phosphate export permease